MKRQLLLRFNGGGALFTSVKTFLGFHVIFAGSLRESESGTRFLREGTQCNDFQCCNGHLPSIVNTCDFLICIAIAVTYVLVKRCFLIELIPSSSDERDAIQKKTFTKWVNKHLKKVTIDFYIIMLEWKTKTFLEKHQF